MRINLPFNRQMHITKRGIAFVKDGCITGISDWKMGIKYSTSTPILEQVYFTIANEFAKLDLRHIIENVKVENGVEKHVLQHVHDSLEFLVAERPNNYQSKYDFLFTMAYQMYKYGNAIAFLERDERNHVVSIIPQNVENLGFGNGYKNIDGVIWYEVKHLNTNKVELVRYDNIIHLRLNPNNIFYGDSCVLDNADALIKIVNKQFNSLLASLDSNGTVKGIVKMGSSAQGFANMALGNQENKEKKQEEINKRIQKAKGVLVLDAGEEWQNLSTPFDAISSSEIDKYIDLILQIYGINKKIVDGSANYEEMEVFHASRITPIMERFIQEANYKIFDTNSLTRGHRIEYYRNPFEYIPIDKAIDIAYKGIQDTTTNERRRMLYKLAPIENGDLLVTNKNFELIKETENGKN